MDGPSKPANASEYLARLPDDQRAQLGHVRNLIRNTVPDAEERISYGMPCYYVNGKALLCIGGFKKHSSLFGIGPDLQGRFGPELNGYIQSKGTIQFTLKNPLPDDLVERMVRWRVGLVTGGN